MFMKEANGMHHFMDNRAKASTAMPNGNYLLSTLSLFANRVRETASIFKKEYFQHAIDMNLLLFHTKRGMALGMLVITY